MGKAAHNETIKLRAAFWNNLAVTLLATAIIIPMYAVLYSQTRFMSIGEVVGDQMFWPALTTAGLAIGVAFVLRSFAGAILSHVQD
jgi:ABC-type sulfate transport system permease component